MYLVLTINFAKILKKNVLLSAFQINADYGPLQIRIKTIYGFVLKRSHFLTAT